MKWINNGNALKMRRKKMIEGLIGRLHWDGCEGCKHMNTIDGGCDMTFEEFKRWLSMEICEDTVICGAYERLAEEEQ